MAGIGLYLSRTRRDVIFPSLPAQGGVAYAVFRNVPEAEALQRQMGPCPGCDGYAVFVYFLNAGAVGKCPRQSAEDSRIFSKADATMRPLRRLAALVNCRW